MHVRENSLELVKLKYTSICDILSLSQYPENLQSVEYEGPSKVQNFFAHRHGKFSEQGAYNIGYLLKLVAADMTDDHCEQIRFR